MHRFAPLWGLGFEALVLSGLALHAHARTTRRGADERAIAAVSRLMPGADLSLAGALAPPVEVYAAVSPSGAKRASPQPLGQAPSGPSPK